MHQLSPYLKRIRTASQRTRPGLPPTLKSHVAEGAISTAAERDCVAFRHRRISRSPTGEEAYRLIATLDNGEVFPMVYHVRPVELQAPSQLAAAINAAIEPFDMTERTVLSSMEASSLSAFAPELLFIESTPQVFHYIVEEIAGTPPSGDSLIAVAGELPAFHSGLLEWAETTRPHLPSRHEQYFIEVAPTMEAVITDLAVAGNGPARALSDRWQAVFELHALLADHDRQPIHGDLHRWNVFVLEPPRSGIKVIDWDSVAWGVPHVDLATLLMEEDPDLQQRALEAFVVASDRAEHLASEKDLYLHARFHVSVLWSCFFATDRRWSSQASALKRYLEEAVRLLDVLT